MESRNNSSSQASNAAPKQPQAVMVLGMHRSGTSALVRVLNLLGCALSDNLIGAGEGNETGHWEPAGTVALNDEILASAGSGHDDWGPINDDWQQSAIRAQMVQRAAEVLADHARQGPLFAIKDPRMCRLADLWFEASDKAGIEPLVVLMVRHPAEVAASLETRDLMVTGYAELLWLRHVLDAERASRGRKRVVCRYGQLLRHWQGVAERIKIGLGIAFPRNSPRTRLEIDEFLSRSQRHHFADRTELADQPSGSDWPLVVFEIMSRWSEQGEAESDYPVLDDISAQLDRSYGTFAPLLLTQGAAGSVGAGQKSRNELAELRQEIEQLNAELDQRSVTDEEVAGLRAELAAKTTALSEMEAALNAARAEAEAEQLRRAEATESVTRLSHELQGLEQRNAELQGQVAVAQSASIQRQEELAQSLRQFEKAEEARIRAEADAAAQAAAVKKFTSQLARQEDIIRSAQSQIEEGEHQIERLTDLNTRLEAASKQAEVARKDAEQKLAARFDELSQLTTIVAEENSRATAWQSASEWLSDVRRIEEGFPAWWAIMPSSWRQKWSHRRYRRAGLFDAEAYLALYPDVGAQGMDPLRHYILHGMAEGRSRPQPG